MIIMIAFEFEDPFDLSGYSAGKHNGVLDDIMHLRNLKSLTLVSFFFIQSII
jgi:hypothetical protein